MKLNKKKQTIETDESIPGLLNCSYEYSIKETSASLTWMGPKIPQDVWYAITSFFKWTYDTTKSESQVRLYVSPTQGTWKAWAFPQEARTGMSAQEINSDDAKAQRERLAFNPPDWYYFGTVHHHCSMSAFQSGTDRENEEGQDGLHITVGNLDKPQYDIHARFYRKTMKFETTLDLSWFFDVGDVLETWPEIFKDDMPKNLAHATAKKLMGKPVEVEFPAEWRTNLIEIKPVITLPVPTVYGSPSYNPHITAAPNGHSAELLPAWKRGQNAWKHIMHKAYLDEIHFTDISDAIQDMGMSGFAYNLVLEACLQHSVQLDDLIRQQPNNLEQDMVEHAAKMELAAIQDERTKKDEKNPPSLIDDHDGMGWPRGYCT